ncbi:MAG TPA: hypothetical protein VEC37_00795 [Bacillota bacterium]|nr:hypothetical protein [Bacillota bacterium]
MGLKKKLSFRRSLIFSLLSILSIMSFLGFNFRPNEVQANVAEETQIAPSAKIVEGQEWKRVDTKYCRFYYHQENEYIKAKIAAINTIYEDICNKFKHYAKGRPEEDGLVTLFLLDDSAYKSTTGDLVAGAGCDKGSIFINIGRNNTNLAGTCRHELIHAVTVFSPDSKLVNYPHWFAEGIAQYYQPNLEKGGYNVALLKNALETNQLFPWSVLGKSGWGNENRPLKYTQAACMFEYLIQKYGEEKIIEIFYTEGDFLEIIKRITGKSIKEIEKDWQKDIKLKLR